MDVCGVYKLITGICATNMDREINSTYGGLNIKNRDSTMNKCDLTKD
jgi:hypothetical protein